MTETLALTLAYLVDLIIGDPRWMPHPVSFIGGAIQKLENYLRKEAEDYDHAVKNSTKNNQGNGDENEDPEKGMNIFELVAPFHRKGKEPTLKILEQWAGVILPAVVVGATYLLFFILSNLLLNIPVQPVVSYVLFGIYVYLVSTTIATRDLLLSAHAVIDALKQGDIQQSRQSLSMIVGRDTDSLKEEGVLRAAIETVAENASDGIIAPLFYFVIGGLPLAMAYKAINTLDSMVGYKNEKYGSLGWASAKLDDIANYIPARITGVLIATAVYVITIVMQIVAKGSLRFKDKEGRLARFLMKILAPCDRKLQALQLENGSSAFTIMTRDGKRHASPNSGFPEAAMAGALGVRLGGPSVYEGTVINKPYIGDDTIQNSDKTRSRHETYVEAARSALTVTKVTSFLGFIAAVLIV